MGYGKFFIIWIITILICLSSIVMNDFYMRFFYNQHIKVLNNKLINYNNSILAENDILHEQIRSLRTELSHLSVQSGLLDSKLLQADYLLHLAEQNLFSSLQVDNTIILLKRLHNIVVSTHLLSPLDVPLQSCIKHLSYLQERHINLSALQHLNFNNANSTLLSRIRMNVLHIMMMPSSYNNGEYSSYLYYLHIALVNKDQKMWEDTISNVKHFIYDNVKNNKYLLEQCDLLSSILFKDYDLELMSNQLNQIISEHYKIGKVHA